MFKAKYTIFANVISFELFFVSRGLNIELVLNMALIVFLNNIRVIVIGMIWREEPDIQDMNRFIGICFPGPIARSQIFFFFNSSNWL